MDRKSAEEFFLERLAAIDRAISFVCKRHGLQRADAEDFASSVKLRLIENDYAAIRKYRGRSSFETFIVVVVRRMFLDQRTREWGRWRASAEAKRLGEAAIHLDELLHRDGRTFDEAAPLIASAHALTLAAVRDLFSRLPRHRQRPRAVELEHVDAEKSIPAEEVERVAFGGDNVHMARRLEEVLHRTMKELGSLDLAILRMRFFSGLTVAQIARTLGQDQKLLYRRIDTHLRHLRGVLEKEGIRSDQMDDLLDHLPETFAMAIRQAPDPPEGL